MKVVILAGGLGTRLSEYTESIPKPMVTIGNLPIIVHIMKYYSMYGFNEFYLALGYKSEEFHKFFNEYDSPKEWNINLIDTGLETMTGGRLKRLQKQLSNQTFMLTYGDGLSNINIKKLLEFHHTNKKMLTISAVRPPARFGALELEGTKVKKFTEKSQTDEGWINGGFFVCEKNIFEYLKNDQTILEKEPFEVIANKDEMRAYKHYDFWQCMDTKRDKDNLESMYKMKKAPWI
ncbi:glucose-1-phosphate cytidylyltransferase [Pelagibacterales bacterium]|nr:glucose-1-phosphate cytidylyltransferase [Pelagibacterales bacterium]